MQRLQWKSDITKEKQLSYVATETSISWAAGAQGCCQGTGEGIVAQQTRPPVPEGGMAVSLRMALIDSSCHQIIKGYHTTAGTSCSKE